MTVIKHKQQRVGVFIDTQNLYHSAKNLYHARVNFGAIMKEAVAGRSLIRAIAYVITTESGDETNFFDALGKLGIETKTKNLQIFSGGAKKGDWDVGLAVDAIKLAPKLDTVIIASGDGDFCPLVEYLQTNEGCQVEVISFGKSSSQKLKEVADDFIDMCDSPSKYVMMQNSQQNTGERGNRQERPNKEIQTRPKNNPAPKKQSKNSNENKPITTNTRKDFDFFDPEERPDSKFDI
ncbi:MAG: NYN domain-containing protein [bacterium]